MAAKATIASWQHFWHRALKEKLPWMTPDRPQGEFGPDAVAPVPVFARAVDRRAGRGRTAFDGHGGPVIVTVNDQRTEVDERITVTALLESHRGVLIRR
jgi:hypothetical protein